MTKKTLIILAAIVSVTGISLGLAAVVAQKPPVPPDQIDAATPRSSRASAIKAPAAVTLGESASVETPAFKTLFSKEPDRFSVIYKVQRGDNLTRIARKFGKTADLVKRVNGLKDDKLAVGMQLKVPTGRFSLVVDKSQNTMILKIDEEVLKTYVVATGRDNSTPVGVFKITDRLVNPVWYKTGAAVPAGSPDNELGTRWLGFTAKGYGIHGTIKPETIGHQATSGCVRMRNDEVEELFEIVPSGTEVTIVD